MPVRLTCALFATIAASLCASACSRDEGPGDRAERPSDRAEAAGAVTDDITITVPPATADEDAMSLLAELERGDKSPGDRDRARAIHREALALHERGEYARAEASWGDAARADPSWERPYYNLACATALQGRPDDALAYLELVRDSAPDLYRLGKLESDRDLRSLRDRPGFHQVVHDTAAVLLSGRYRADDASAPRKRRKPQPCRALEIEPTGALRYQCDDNRFVALWTYAGGTGYYRITEIASGIAAMGAERSVGGSDVVVLDERADDAWGAFAIAKFTAEPGPRLCLTVARAREWPITRPGGPGPATRRLRPDERLIGCFVRE